ncbi:MAG: pre-peptidase C-terminal domain-containing protein [Planctomycetales bacterium]|nr:pre-peptidase C-terminal domain-containing protein [Planctomycetales bacterium]
MVIRSRRPRNQRQRQHAARPEKPAMRLEQLEDRQLLAGLTLAGVLPNDGVLMQNGDIRNVAPQDITLRFDQAVDPSTLDAIQLIRAGGDGAFASATVSSDFNTNGAVQMRFDAAVPGDPGNGVTLIVSTADLSSTNRDPALTVQGNTIFIELNSNPSAVTRAFDLRDTMNANPAVASLVQASVTGGNAFTTIGNRAVNYSPLTLTGANTSRGTVDFNKVGLEIEFRSVATGAAGSGIVVNFSVNNFGGAAPPQITVNNRVVNIVVNSNPGNQTTALGLITAVNNNATVNQLIRASINSGSPLTVIGNTAPPAPLTLTGANDVAIVPGFVGLGTVPSEVVMRFAEPLPDDTYQLTVRGTGANPLQTPSGVLLNNGAIDESLTFELDLGAQIISVVPQPIERDSQGRLHQLRDTILVYFNDDDLDRTSAETPSFYKLLLSNDTVTNTDDLTFLPTSVSYNADQDLATLTFASPIDELVPGGGAGSWRLRIGTDEGTPLAPNRLTPTVDPDDTFAGALDLSSTFDTGSAMVVLGGGDVFADGQRFTITDLDGTSVTFEFEGSQANGVDGDNRQIQFVPQIVQSQMVAQIRDVILSAPGLDVDVVANGNTLLIDGDLSISLSPDLTGIQLAKQGIIVSGTIDNTGQPYRFTLPGGIDDIGHRDIPVETHLLQGADVVEGITTAFYNFQDVYGVGTLGGVLHNAITDLQKQRAREIFQIYSDLLGIQFIETPSSGMTIVTGDMAPLMEVNGVGGVLGVAGGGLEGLAIMDLQDFDDSGDDVFGGPWFQTAMHEIGHLLGLGHNYELPDPAIMGSDPTLNPVAAEPIFPADSDIIHGQFLYRPESKDIDVYKFAVNETGVLTAETFAERLANTSLLDTTLTLYRETETGAHELVARNDDYNSEDSLLQVELTPGTYFVAVSASGNDAFNPDVDDSGFGGVTEGAYELRLNFRGLGDTNRIVDADLTPTALDGDGDGVAGGAYNFWFRTQSNNHLLFVDKAATNDAIANSGPAHGTPRLFRNIKDAISASVAGDIIRIVGNGGADGDLSTVADNKAYEIGFSALNVALADGTALEIPKDRTVMIDSSAIIKLRHARIGVGSSDTVVDRSGAALQVLGVPRLIDASGQVRRDSSGNVLPGSVYFTSIHDDLIGTDTDPNFNPPDPAEADWGGIIFRRRVDKADASRKDYESRGIFLNYINNADIQYAGGDVVIDAQSRAVSPIELDEARATISYNSIHDNAGSAIKATPDTFEETNFHSTQYQLPGEFTSDYTRIGPDIVNNRLARNSVNGLEIQVRTPAGASALPLTVAARFDDASITHVLAENLMIQATPGGPTTTDAAPPVNLVVSTANPVTTGAALPAGDYRYRVVFVDAAGNEGPPSNATTPITIAGGSSQSITLTNVPIANGFVARRIYRSIDGGAFVLARQINSFTTTFVDDGTTIGGALAEFTPELRARTDARLAVDPRVIVKISDAVIDVGVGAQLIAEGRDGEEVVFTSIHDQRYGAGGTFDTNDDGVNDISQPGNWAGIFGWHESTVSLEHAVVAYGGGTTRQSGAFRGFSAIEAHQSQFRLANSVIELSAPGEAAIADDRFGRGANGPAAVFVRGNEPIIVNNIFRDNVAQAISIDVNSMSGELVEDYGGSVGEADAFTGALGNQGALIRGNLLNNNDINGVVVRGGTLTRDGVWDDTDIVHVVFDQITVPDLHTYGGLRLESSATESLVVKLSGATAGFVAAGQQLDIDDRVGGALHILGQPGKPVVLTSLTDYSVGAGFTPEGLPQVNTENIDLANPPGGGGGGGGTTLPTGPEVNLGTAIDNDVANTIPGSFGVQPGPGGNIFFGSDRATFQGAVSGLITNFNFIFDFSNHIDVGANGNAIDLSTTTITQAPTLIAPDVVQSTGTLVGNNGNIVNWEVITSIQSGETRLTNQVTLSSAQPLGTIQFINYLDEDLGGVSDDFLTTTGTPGADDFRAYTLDGPERVGFAQGGIVTPGAGLVNATYDGWAADRFADLISAIGGAGTTYTIPGNIDLTDLPLFVDATLGNSWGPNDVTTAFAWSVDPNANTAVMTSFLELLPSDPGDPDTGPVFGAPGDWQGVVLEAFSHDRNVDVLNELEPQDAITGSNGTIDKAEDIGQLSPSFATSDENLRLGLQVNGILSSSADADIYRFEAEAGTPVVIDIDRTTHALDTVVELLAADGTVLARSDNSTAEIDDPTLIQTASFILPGTVNPLQISEFSDPDRYTTNPRDAGFAIRLPGAAGVQGPYFIRVSSAGGKGAYQLQLRLDTLDEFPGSTIRNADIRFAGTGISVQGQPIHSPLLGEIAEDNTVNDTVATAQRVGNVLASDRAVVSIAGRIASTTDVDMYEFQLNYEDVQPGTAGGLVPVVIDIDYADGLGRPNTTISIFDAAGALVATTRDGNIGGDLPRAGKGLDLTDLSRGSVGDADAFLGPFLLGEGTYTLAIHNDTIASANYGQYTQANPNNPLARLEPNISVVRIVDEHIDGGLGTAADPIVPDFLGNQGVVPYFLGDVVLYVSQASPAVDNAEVLTVNPFTGATLVNLGNVGREIADIDFRNDQTLVALTKDLTDVIFEDAEAGNYLTIDDTGAANPLGTLVADDGIQTFELDLTSPPNPVRSNLFNNARIGDGIHFEAIEVGTFNNAGEIGLAVGNRPCFSIDTVTRLCNSTDDYRRPPGIPTNYNILYQFDPQTGVAFSSPAPDRTSTNLVSGAGTQIVERGFLNTDASLGSATSNTKLVITAEPTILDPGTIINIADEQVTFTVDPGPLAPSDVFQLVSGPEIQLTMLPGTPNPLSTTEVPSIFMDGWIFNIDGTDYEIDTGGVLVIERDARFIEDGDLFVLTDLDGASQTFEFDKNNNVQTPGAIAVPINSALSAFQVAQRVVNTVNAQGGFTFSAALLNTANPNFNTRISFIDTRSVSATQLTPSNAALVVEGQQGSVTGNIVIPIEETSNNQDFVVSILNVFSTLPGAEASAEGDRVNFPGAMTGDFSGILNGAATAGVNSPIVDLMHDGTPSLAGAIPVPFGVDDTALELAQRIVDVLNDTYVLNPTDPLFAQLDGSGNVELVLGGVFTAADDPLETAGDAPGGSITGITIASPAGGQQRVYAVSSNGGLYQIINPTTPLGAQAVYVNSSTQLTGIEFAGLTTGPRSVEGGRYADLLFAIDTSGEIYAFDYNGVLQPVFMDGATSIQTGLTGANGLVFAGLDRNLWSETTIRSGDAGNGIAPVPDRLGVPNTQTMRFGGGINTPGGAFGAVESEYFSLEGYSSLDQPVLYFNYFLETENANSAIAMRDAFNVYINYDGDNWDLLADNNSATNVAQQNTYDIGDAGAPNSWRQARVDLSAYAGMKNLSLRFEFHTGATYEFGTPRIGGFEIRALSGDQLRDGEVFTIDNTNFELEFGPTLVAPTGTNIQDGQQFKIHNVTFEFDKSGNGVPSNNVVEIDVSNDLSPDAVALVIEQALASADYVYRANLSEVNSTPNDKLTDVVDTGLLGGGDRFEATGTIGDNLGGADVDLVRLQLNIGDVLDVQVGSPGPNVLNPVIRFFDQSGVPIGVPVIGNTATFTAAVSGTYVVGLSGEGNETYDITGPSTATNGDTGAYTLALIVNGFNGITPRTFDNRIQLDGGVKFDPLTSTVEADGAAGVSPGNVMVDIHSDMTDDEVAVVIQQAIADTFAGGQTNAIKRYNQVVKIIGHTLVDAGPMPGITGSLPGHDAGAGSTVFDTGPNSFPQGELRFQNNNIEGVYIDDIIIGFAERGEVATLTTPDDSFVPNPLAVGGVPTGEYQAEIRLGAPIEGTTFQTNDRFEGQSATLQAPGANELIDGQTFVISDGVSSAIFEFEDVNIGNGVAPGRTPIPFDPSRVNALGIIDPEPGYVIAQRIVQAVNSPAVQGILDVTAALSDGVYNIDPFIPADQNSTSNQVNLFGDFVDIGASVPVLLTPDMSIAAEFAVVNVGNDTDVTATDSGNAGGIAATIVTSGTIGDNPNKTGFDAPLDVDLIRVRLATGDVVTIDVDAAELGSTLDSYIRVFDLTGNELAANYSGRAPDDELATTDSYLQFVAPASGIYYIGVSGVSQDTDSLGTPLFDMFGNPILIGNLDYDLQLSPSGTADGATTGDYSLTIDILSGGIEVIRYTDVQFGDKNVVRDQGQLIIESTIVRNSANFGIDVGAAPRTGPDTDVPHQGAVRNLRELNTQRLVPGAVLMNNVLIENDLGGIRFAGDANPGQAAAVPFGRIFNNTLVGNGGTLPNSAGGNDTGILVENNASPTIANNIIANFATGVDISADSQTTVLGGNLVQGNGANLSGTTPSLGESAIVLADTETLFLDRANGVYYLGAGSRAIDSSISRMDDRGVMTTVKMPLGLGDSPILAPLTDALGQIRKDDPNTGTPGSTGEDMFVDRGAIERADGAGPTAILIVPRDNDSSGVDRDPTVTIVELSNENSLSNFTIQLLDGVAPVDSANGVGVNDNAVSPDQITILRDGVELIVGVDYRFGYDSLNDVIRLTPTAGLWETDHVYKIIMANGDQFVLTAPDGATTNDGDTFTITDQDGNVVTFEYDSGYLLTVEETLTLQIPEEGGTLGGVTDREQITVFDGAQTFVFEFDNNGNTSGGTIPVIFTPVMTDDEVAQQLVDALESANVGLQPKLIGDGKVHLGASPVHTFDITLAPSLSLSGSQTAGGVVDGDVLIVDDGTVLTQYEFDNDGQLNDTANTRLAFNYNLTHIELAQLIGDRLTADTTLTPLQLANGRVHIGGTRVTVVDASASNLTLSGQPGVFSEFGIQIPSVAGQPNGIVDQMTFQVGNGISLPVTFEFDDDGDFVLGNTLITFNANTTLDQLANQIASQISAVGIGLSPINVGGGFIELTNDTINHVFNPLTSPLLQTGTPGVAGNEAIPFIPDVTFTAIDMAAAVADAINASDLNSVGTQRGDDVLVSNVGTITGIVDAFVESIRDYAGNVLQANQGDGTTQFTILFGDGQDFGDAAGLPTLEAVNGARHTVVPGYSLGADVDVDPDGQPTFAADGDDTNSRDDEDGVTHDGIVPGFTTTFTITANGITATRPGFLDAWVDFDHDGVLEPNEKIANSMPLVNGANQITMPIPATVTLGDSLARFRLSSTGGLGVSGPASDGEVEDYRFQVTASGWTNPANQFDVVPDSVITPFDLLKVLVFLQTQGPQMAPKNAPIVVGSTVFDLPPASSYYDVTRDGQITINDLRVLFNFMAADGEGEGEGEGEGLAMASTQFDTTTLSANALGAPLTNSGSTLGAGTVREIEFLLTPPPEVDAESESLLDSLPIDTIVDQVAGEIASRRELEESEDVDAFFAQFELE